MQTFKIACSILVLFIAACIPKSGHLMAQKQLPVVKDPRVEKLLAKMTLEEKIGQMTQFTTDWESTGPTIRDGYKNDIRKGNCGSLFNSHTVKFTRELQRIAVEETRLKIPLIFGYDVIHGYKTIFPIPLGEAASWDLGAIEQSARIAAVEASAAGLHWTFAPMVDIARDPRWGRVMEGAGEDPYLGSRIAEARVHGFQGKGPGNTDAVMACVKHYAGYGAAIAGRDYNNVDMGERYFREFYLPPYKAAVEAGAMTVMTSFNDYDGTPATANKFLITDVLRGEWGFKGIVVTDYTAINEMVNHGVAADDKGAGELAANAGIDMDMQGAVFQRFMAQSIKEGKVTMETVDEAVRRILKIKYDLGLFDNPYKYCDEAREKREILSADHLSAARDVARKSIVLLKNQGNVLPLSADQKKIVVVGPLAENKSELIGSWSGSGNANDCVSLAEGLKARKGVNVSIFKGFDFKGNMLPDFTTAVEAVKGADVVIIAAGESADQTGEASSRAEIGLPGNQEDIVASILAIGKPTVLVLMNGRPLAIPKLIEKAPAILETWWLGTQTGNAIADVLFGDYNPSGKLPMSFPRSVGQVPVFYNQKSTGRPYDPNSKWTSKYLDMPNAPQFAFGFGLSYTTFAYSEPKVDKTVFKQSEPIHISVTVTNTGARDGEEVVQLYVRDLVGSVTRPVKELKGFRKIMIPKGGSKEVVFTITEQDLRFYRKDMQFASEPGDFDLMVGGSSDNVKQVRVTMTADH